jgi:hypothetical protein
LRDEDLVDIGFAAVDRAIGAAMPESLRPATKVVVFQWPCGIAAHSRSPFGARPWRRAMLVEAHVSSMKTSRSGSSSGWPSNPSRRRLRTCGRSCSSACAVFF